MLRNCIPKNIIYLKNRRNTHIFTPSRIWLVSHIAFFSQLFCYFSLVSYNILVRNSSSHGSERTPSREKCDDEIYLCFAQEDLQRTLSLCLAKKIFNWILSGKTYFWFITTNQMDSDSFFGVFAVSDVSLNHESLTTEKGKHISSMYLKTEMTFVMEWLLEVSQRMELWGQRSCLSTDILRTSFQMIGLFFRFEDILSQHFVNYPFVLETRDGKERVNLGMMMET